MFKFYKYINFLTPSLTIHCPLYLFHCSLFTLHSSIKLFRNRNILNIYFIFTFLRNFGCNLFHGDPVGGGMMHDRYPLSDGALGPSWSRRAGLVISNPALSSWPGWVCPREITPKNCYFIFIWGGWELKKNKIKRWEINGWEIKGREIKGWEIKGWARVG